MTEPIEAGAIYRTPLGAELIVTKRVGEERGAAAAIGDIWWAEAYDEMAHNNVRRFIVTTDGLDSLGYSRVHIGGTAA